jgi:hypothetical protein
MSATQSAAGFPDVEAVGGRADQACAVACADCARRSQGHSQRACAVFSPDTGRSRHFSQRAARGVFDFARRDGPHEYSEKPVYVFVEICFNVAVLIRGGFTRGPAQSHWRAFIDQLQLQ